MNNIVKLEDLCIQVRRDIIRMVYNANSGHPGGALGCVELLVVLFFKIMNYTLPLDPKGKNNDMFFLSNGHICSVLYSVLSRAGFFETKELNTFRKINSKLQGHPALKYHLPGIFISTGSLGQGLSVAVGAAQAKKLDNDNSIIYCLTGDGELQEGQIWEALMFINHYKVNSLITIVDYNGRQIDGDVKNVLTLGKLKEKFEAFGINVIYEPEGNNITSVTNSLKEAISWSKKGLPTAIILQTEMGKGVDFMEGSHSWHGKAPNEEQFKKALTQLPET
ncbi:MAG: transketolase [Solitalea-like symbiont of Acarus siro]